MVSRDDKLNGHGATVCAKAAHTSRFVTLTVRRQTLQSRRPSAGTGRGIVAIAAVADVAVAGGLVSDEDAEQAAISTVEWDLVLPISNTTIEGFGTLQITGNRNDVTAEDPSVQRWLTRGIRVDGHGQPEARNVRITGVKLSPERRSEHPRGSKWLRRLRAGGTGISQFLTRSDWARHTLGWSAASRHRRPDIGH